MSKYDSEIRAAGEARVELDDLFVTLGGVPAARPHRRDAMAQYLSGEDGWRDARKALRGTFAKPSGNGTGLTSGEDK